MSWIIYFVVELLQFHHLKVALVAVFVYHLIRRLLRWLRFYRSLPPGPCGLPVVGYLPFLKRPDDIRKELTDMSCKYGPCFSIRLGSELLVVLSDHRLIREAFRNPVFDARPRNEFFKLMKGYGMLKRDLQRFI